MTRRRPPDRRQTLVVELTSAHQFVQRPGMSSHTLDHLSARVVVQEVVEEVKITAEQRQNRELRPDLVRYLGIGIRGRTRQPATTGPVTILIQGASAIYNRKIRP